MSVERGRWSDRGPPLTTLTACYTPGCASLGKSSVQVRLGAVVVVVMMTVGAVHVTVLQFLLARLAHVEHLGREAQRDARERMVRVEYDGLVGEVGHRED